MADAHDVPSVSSDEATATARWAALAGQTVSHYRILEKLGEGGMGVVYKAHDEKLDRFVALKFLPALVRDDRELKEQLVREAKAASALDHPNIVVIHDFDITPDGTLFVAMAYHEGRTLRAVIHDALTVRAAVSIARQIASGLARAHERGVFHRDIKPSNVVVTPDGTARIIDFGLAKPADGTVTLGAVKGTPLYMSPEQAAGGPVDGRSDLWSLGAVLYEMLTSRRPFEGDSTAAILRAIATREPVPVRTITPEVPPALAAIVKRALEKDPRARYQSAADMLRDLNGVEAEFSAPTVAVPVQSSRYRRWLAAAILLLVAVVGLGGWLYVRAVHRGWVKETAIPQIAKLRRGQQPLEAWRVFRQAVTYLPGDAELATIAAQLEGTTSITSDPPGATVEIQDYLTPQAVWYTVGTTPLNGVTLPKGYFRWRVTKTGSPTLEIGSSLRTKVAFSLNAMAKTAPGAVPVPADQWANFIAFVGWIGPYDLPAYDLDRFEVTNRQYQEFVDQGGYENERLWTTPLVRDGRPIAWRNAMAALRDQTGRPGPSTWSAGHYPEGRAEYPVSGIGWYEASAYAAFAGRSLPTMAQWYQAADPDSGNYTTRVSNLAGKGAAPVGQFKGVGPFGTYDMAGNVREWCLNAAAGSDSRLILGGAWSSPDYLFDEPEALPPFDRSDRNGIRLVMNHGTLPANALAAVSIYSRNLAEAKPAPDPVFQAYKSLYVDDGRPLAIENGPVVDAADWRREKVTFDAAYGNARVPAFVFVPKHVKPPYQAVVFFPSARAQYVPSSDELVDMNFVDYVIQSGRLVIYPIYQATYERLSAEVRTTCGALPSASRARDILIQQVKDAERAVDYLETRADVDRTRIGYLGVSMGSAAGVMVGAVEDRFKVMVWLDGGLFLDRPAQGTDQVDFAPRMTKPLLMVNGRYDFVFPLEASQKPLFAMVGTPAPDKSHVVLNAPHDVSALRAELAESVLAWLDKYLGRVR